MDTGVVHDRLRLPAPSDPVDEWSDEELTALALAADPDPVLEQGAVPLGGHPGADGLMPGWYMPVPRGRVRKRWQVALLVLVVVLLLLINAAGLCNTYGRLVVA